MRTYQFYRRVQERRSFMALLIMLPVFLLICLSCVSSDDDDDSDDNSPDDSQTGDDSWSDDADDDSTDDDTNAEEFYCLAENGWSTYPFPTPPWDASGYVESAVGDDGIRHFVWSRSTNDEESGNTAFLYIEFAENAFTQDEIDEGRAKAHIGMVDGLPVPARLSDTGEEVLVFHRDANEWTSESAEIGGVEHNRINGVLELADHTTLVATDNFLLHETAPGTWQSFAHENVSANMTFNEDGRIYSLHSGEAEEGLTIWSMDSTDLSNPWQEEVVFDDVLMPLAVNRIASAGNMVASADGTATYDLIVKYQMTDGIDGWQTETILSGLPSSPSGLATLKGDGALSLFWHDGVETWLWDENILDGANGTPFLPIHRSVRLISADYDSSGRAGVVIFDNPTQHVYLCLHEVVPE